MNDYIKKLEEENQLLHKENEELYKHVKEIPGIVEKFIDLKRKCNFMLEGYILSVEGYNTLIKYLVEKKESKIVHKSLTPFVAFKLDEHYQDNMCPEHCPYSMKDKEKITENECFAAGFTVSMNKDCYEKSNVKYPDHPNTIYPSQVEDTSLDGTHMAQAYIVEADIEPLPPKPLGFHVCPIPKDA